MTETALVTVRHGGSEPSPWVRRWTPLIRAGGTVLDVACGSGRHVRWLAAQGFEVTGVDRDAAALEALADTGAERIVADLETGPWPVAGRTFDAIVVTNYLWRPLLPLLRSALAVDGVWLYETFADGQATVGRPSRPAFLLRHGELLAAAEGLRVVAYEDGFLDGPPRFVQRLAAVALSPSAPGDAPARHPLL